MNVYTRACMCTEQWSQFCQCFSPCFCFQNVVLIAAWFHFFGYYRIIEFSIQLSLFWKVKDFQHSLKYYSKVNNFMGIQKQTICIMGMFRKGNRLVPFPE